MFLIADDDRRVSDTRGRVVGFVINGKFTQEWHFSQYDSDKAEAPYANGLSPLEMEMVSETIQRDKHRKTGSDGEGL